MSVNYYKFQTDKNVNIGFKFVWLNCLQFIVVGQISNVLFVYCLSSVSPLQLHIYNKRQTRSTDASRQNRQTFSRTILMGNHYLHWEDILHKWGECKWDQVKKTINEKDPNLFCKTILQTELLGIDNKDEMEKERR